MPNDDVTTDEITIDSDLGTPIQMEEDTVLPDIAEPSLGHRDNPLSQTVLERPTGNPLQIEEVLEPLRQLQRRTACTEKEGDQSHIGFVRKNPDGKFQNLFAFTLTELEKKFDQVSLFLTQDAYFTVNGMYRTAPFRNKVTGLPDVWRQIKHLRYLNACFADLDVGRDQGTPAQRLTVDEAVTQLQDMIQEGLLPKPSMSVRSGRGLYLFWFLGEEKHLDCPPRAYPEKLALYDNIQQGIVKRLRHLAADPRARDAARVLRVPGTLHSMTQRPAEYRIMGKREQDNWPTTYEPPIYTLEQLAKEFAVSVKESSTSESSTDIDKPEDHKSRGVWAFARPIAKRGSVPKRARGAQVRSAHRAQDLLKLEQHYGGWSKGCRLNRLWLYAGFLAGAGHSRDEIYNALQDMAGRCHPPYPSDSNDKKLTLILEEALRSSLLAGNDTLCSTLEVTPELARSLDLQSIVPLEVRCERTPIYGGRREEKRQARWVAIKEYVSHYGLQSSRAIATALREQGFSVSDWTVNADMRALGYEPLSPMRQPGLKRAEGR